MGGQQRNSEGEQVCWMYSILMNFFLCFGRKGRTFGRPYGKGQDTQVSITSAWSENVQASNYTNNYPHMCGNSSGYNDPIGGPLAPYLNDAGTSWSRNLVDTTKVTFEPLIDQSYSTIPVFLWLDAVEATGKAKITENGKQVWPSRWNDPQIKNLPVPVKFLWHVAGNININQNGDCNLATKILTQKNSACVNNTAIPGVPGVQDNPNGYTLEFIGLCDVVMTSSARWADLVLPGTIGFERYQGGLSGRSPMTYVTKKVTEPQGDALEEVHMGAELAAAFGERENYYGNINANNGLSFEENVWRANLNLQANIDKFGRDFEGWVKDGMYKNESDLTLLENYIAYAAYLKNPGIDFVPAKRPSAYSASNGDTLIPSEVNNQKTAFYTLSGRVEAYCLTMMEEYEMRGYDNVDPDINLVNSGTIYTKVTEDNGTTGKGRYVYGIPMYIPIIEGMHADETAAPHPDPMGLTRADYPYCLHTWHIIYRSHSTFNSSPYTNEVKYYKRDAEGNPTHLHRSLTNENAGATPQVSDEDTSAPMVWTEGVYETVWLNHATAEAEGISEGDVIIVESPRGKIKASAHRTHRVRPGVVMIGQGSWYNPANNGEGGAIDPDIVDNGGNANTLFSLRPSRIGQGMTLASDCRIRIYKA